MNWLDIVVIVIIVILLFDGWSHGLPHLVSEFIGIGLGIIVAWLLYRPFAEKLDFIKVGGVAEIVAFSVICTIVGIVAALMGHRTVGPHIKRAIPSWASRSGGMILGFVIGAVFSMVAIFFLDRYLALLPGVPLEGAPAVRRVITNALNESILAGLILQWFSSLL